MKSLLICELMYRREQPEPQQPDYTAMYFTIWMMLSNDDDDDDDDVQIQNHPKHNRSLSPFTNPAIFRFAKHERRRRW